MVKLLLVLFALCVVPSIVAAGRHRPLVLFGSVYCDACLAGFETTASFAVPYAHVEVQCTLRQDASIRTFSQKAVTDDSGKYRMLVYGDRRDEVCDVVLVNSPIEGCKQVDPNRDRARVILTRNNGLATRHRYANALGVLKDEPLGICAQVMKQYEDTEADD